jgi:hypothetical protein
MKYRTETLHVTIFTNHRSRKFGLRKDTESGLFLLALLAQANLLELN